MPALAPCAIEEARPSRERRQTSNSSGRFCWNQRRATDAASRSSVVPSTSTKVVSLSRTRIIAEVYFPEHGPLESVANQWWRQGRAGLTSRAPWLVAFVFGLLHGLGFAGALREIGLPQGDIPLALLAFNLGVEAGQLAFVAVVLSVVALGRRLFSRTLPEWIGQVPAYGIGTVAAFWTLERILAA